MRTMIFICSIFFSYRVYHHLLVCDAAAAEDEIEKDWTFSKNAAMHNPNWLLFDRMIRVKWQPIKVIAFQMQLAKKRLLFWL